MAEERNPVAVFRSAAERYVAVVEGAEGRSAGEFLADLLPVLTALYAAALELPDTGAETDELPAVRLTFEQWKEVFDRLQAVLGADDLYWTVVPFGEGPREELAGSLADDLADIHRDVKQGLDSAAAGATEHELLWHWRDDFWAHWGGHAVEALRIIHAHVAAVDGPLFDPE